MRYRAPFAWEDEPDPLEGIESASVPPPVALPTDPGRAHPYHGMPSGELVAVEGRSPREARDHLIRETVRHGASREWAESKVAGALRAWDRGVRNGSITKR